MIRVTANNMRALAVGIKSLRASKPRPPKEGLAEAEWKVLAEVEQAAIAWMNASKELDRVLKKAEDESLIPLIRDLVELETKQR